MNRHKAAKILEYANIVAFVVTLCIPVFLCVVAALNAGQKPTWLSRLNVSTTLLICGVVVLVTRGLFLSVDRERHEWHDLKAEFKFAILHAGTGWSIGIGLASIIAALYFALPDAKAHERFGTAFALYFSVLGLTMAIHAFYRQYAPITNLDFLLSRLITDLRDEDTCYRLYVVYPALNIGYYRHRLASKDPKLSNEDLFSKFNRALRESAPYCQGSVKLITYPLAEYQKLYTAYAKMASPDPNNPELAFAKDATTNAAQVVEDVIGGDFRFGRLRELKPQEFPQHCIIIGDVIYTIVTFNMPIYNPATDDFEPVRQAAEKKKLADLYIYRREDKGFADAVAAHLDEFIELRGQELTEGALSDFLRSRKNGAPAAPPTPKP